MAQAMVDQQIYSQYPKPNRMEEDKDMPRFLDTFQKR